jgi:hypothetical protein
MKKLVYSLLLVIINVSYVFAYVGGISKPDNTRRVRTRAGDCSIGSARTFLDVNNVRAMMLNSGDLWWDRTNAQYGVPKVPQDQIGIIRQVNPLFAGALWLSGKTAGKLKIAAIRFSGNEQEFWPGPINNRTTNKARCDQFNQYWKVFDNEIKDFIADPSKVSENIKFWPGTKNPNLIAKGFDPEDLKNGAPFFDKDGDGIYNPDNGDYPTVKYIDGTNPNSRQPAFASEMIFWFMNDIGNNHTATKGDPMIVQLNCLAFAYATSDDINNMTFYTYDIFNKSGETYTDAYISQFIDSDLGNYNDDYVGCDTTRDLGFCINADDNDETTTVPGYGRNLPLFGVDFFEGPKDPQGNTLKMSSFVYFLNGDANLNDPSNFTEYRNFQEGLTRLGTPFTQGGNCTSPTGAPTKFCFPSNPINNSPTAWSMCSAGLTPRDIRFVQNSGPFQMDAAPQEVSIGIVFVQPPQGAYQGCRVDVEKWLIPADELAQALFDNDFVAPEGPDAPTVEVRASKNALYLNLSNAPISNNFGERYNKNIPPIPRGSSIIDTSYKFEGYIVFQVKNPQEISKLDDLFDNSKASIISLSDLPNSVLEGFNYENLGNAIRVKQSLKFKNSGLEKNFVVTDDNFALGDNKKLVNGKTYYFAALAFAYNNFRDTIRKTSQLEQLKFSSRINIVSGTPHDLENYNLKARAEDGQGIPVKRIFGQGSASFFLEIDNTEEDFIVKNYSKDELLYKGNQSPLKVSVIDPFKVINANYRIEFLDTSANRSPLSFNLAATHWVMNITEEGGASYSIESDRNLDRDFNQEIFINKNNSRVSTGLSVSTANPIPVYQVAKNKNSVFGMLGSELIYENPKDKWLLFIKNSPSTNYLHWIRTGTTLSADRKFLSAFNYIGNTPHFSDSAGIFDNILDGIIAPYCLTANNNYTAVTASNPNDFDNLYSSFGPAFKFRSIGTIFNPDNANSGGVRTFDLTKEGPDNNLDSIRSVDIVMTSNKDKWSRCLVFETGEDPQLTEGNALKGQLRQGASRSIDFEEESDKGRSWFPGYAIDLERGIRLNIYFGENSMRLGKRAGNMIWDPSSDTLTGLGAPVLGGGHYVYVLNTPYDEGAADYTILNTNFNRRSDGTVISPAASYPTTIEISRNVANVYRKIIWTFMPYSKPNFEFYEGDDASKYKIPSQVRFKLRVAKPYAYYLDNQSSVYEFSTKDLSPLNTDPKKSDIFSKTTIVPNPYNAYSAYEASSSQNFVKIHNLPNTCDVSIYTTDGILIRRIKRDIAPNIANMYGGANANIDNTLTWDMKSTAGVLISSGVYYIHIEAPNLGTKVLKFFATMRSTDVSNF